MNRQAEPYQPTSQTLLLITLEIIDALCTLIQVAILFDTNDNDNDNDNDNKHSKVTYPPQECLWP